MSRFRKMPVEIEAVQFVGAGGEGKECPLWWSEAAHRGDIRADRCQPELLVIKTLEGEMRASAGDWIIRGVKGELYPCKPDIFAMTYEPADAPRPTSELVKRLLKLSETMDDNGCPPNDTWDLAAEAAASLQSLEARNKELERALQELADAADTVGVRFFDTDTMEPEVEAMQAATLKARAALHPATKTEER